MVADCEAVWTETLLQTDGEEDPVASRTRSGMRLDSGETVDLLGMEQLELVPQVAEEVIPDVPSSVEDMFTQIEESMIGQVTNIEETGIVGMRPAVTIASDVGMRLTDVNDDDVELCWDTSSVEKEDSDMERPVEEEILSDVVGKCGFKSYFLQLCDLSWYTQPIKFMAWCGTG